MTALSCRGTNSEWETCAGGIPKPGNTRHGTVMQCYVFQAGKLQYMTQTANSAHICISSSVERLKLMLRRMSVGCIDGVLEEGRECFVGGKEIELDRQISEDDYNSGRCFGVGTSNSISEISPAVRMKSKFVPPTSRKPLIPLVERKVTIPLQPVNLASSSNTVVKIDQEPENDTSPSYWTANWQVDSDPYSCSFVLMVELGASNRARLTRPGMATRMWHVKMAN